MEDSRPRALTRCYACEKQLPYDGITSAEDADRSEQWDNALVVSLEGGYGMFIDPIGADDERAVGQLGEYKVVICHECAHELCDAVPWMARLVNPMRSHAHSVKADWTGHEGWDLPHKTT